MFAPSTFDVTLFVVRLWAIVRAWFVPLNVGEPSSPKPRATRQRRQRLPVPVNAGLTNSLPRASPSPSLRFKSLGNDVGEPISPKLRATMQRRRLAPSKAEVGRQKLPVPVNPGPANSLPRASPSPSLRFKSLGNASPWLVKLAISRGEVLQSISESTPAQLPGTTTMNSPDTGRTRVGYEPMEIDQVNGVDLQIYG